MSLGETGERRGGIVVRAAGALWFVPATVAIRVAPTPAIARVPGAPGDLLGISLVDGEIVPIVAIGPDRASVLLCSYLGEALGLVGGEVVATGAFDAALDVAGAVRCGGVVARPLDLSAIYARVQTGSWAGRWRG